MPKLEAIRRDGYRFLALYAVLYVAPFPIDRLPGLFIPIANSYAHAVYALESGAGSI